MTCNHHFSVPTVDTTYKLGEFYVTPMTYHHLMVEDIKTKRHPVMLGPLLVHQKVDFPSLNYFASTLIGLQKEVKHDLAFSTDGDKAIVEALCHNFPFVVQLHCFLHLKKNVEWKLKEFMSSYLNHARVSLRYFRVANQESLVDSKSVQEFDERIENLKPLWVAREKYFDFSITQMWFAIT